MKTTVIVLGDGQLGLMLSKAAKKLDIPMASLSLPDAWEWLKAQKISPSDLVTFEQEHVDESLLQELQNHGVPAFPTWATFATLRSKLSQKKFLQESGIPTSAFLPATHWSPEVEAFAASNVLKAGKGGYDGNGVWMIDGHGNTKNGPAKELIKNIREPYVEKKLDFDFELAAVVCRSQAGEIVVYPSVKSLQWEGICYKVEYSKEFASSDLAIKAGNYAKKIAQELKYVGVLAVEFFAKNNEVFVNEIAPRVHNSGHFTIDVCAGSQFENHLRAGLNMPLASVTPTHPAALMVNLLWPESQTEFAPLFAKLTCGPDWPTNAKLHWYGKTGIRPRRKMGHFTVYGATLKECHEIADQILASRWA